MGMTMGLTEDEQALLRCLPSDGGTKSNRAVQRQLGWEPDRYWAARDSLVDAGHIVRGRGRGGTVRRVAEAKQSTGTVSVAVDVADPVHDIESAVQSELALYDPMRRVIEGDWAKDHRSDPLAVEITALQGRRATGGIWSRPDIVSVEIRTFAYVPGKHLELTTFEVKLASGLSVQSVFEALAHRRASTRSYVLAHVSPHDAPSITETIEEVAEVARAHGVGFVTAGDEQDYDTWEEHVEAQRDEPDPARLDTFIETQLSERTKRLISRRLR